MDKFWKFDFEVLTKKLAPGDECCYPSGMKFETRKESWAELAKKTSIEHRRGVVVAGIERWMAKLRGDVEISRVIPMSRLEDDGRWVCLRYGTLQVPLNAKGDTVGVIPAECNELEFWTKTIADVRAGVFDDGINYSADKASSARKGKRRKTTPAL